MFDDTVFNIFPFNNNFLLWVTYKNEDGHFYYVVSNLHRTEYYLFKDKKQLHYKSDNPTHLYKYMKK